MTRPRPRRRVVPFTLEHLEDRITPVSFGTGNSYVFGGNSGAVAIADINNDGLKDFVACDKASGISIPFLNAGSGNFTQMPSVSTSDPRSIDLVDLNGDGNLDISVAAGSNLAMIFAFGNGDGTFGNSFQRGIAAGALGAHCADFNSDGRPDIAIASGGNLIIAMNNGLSSVFSSTTVYNTGTDTYDLTTGDFNGDGKPDIAMSGYSTNRIDVVLNNGVGGFGSVTSYPQSWHGGGIAAGDLNHDGRDDLVFGLITSGTARSMLSNPDGTFQSPAIASMPSGTTGGFALTDIDMNGTLDVVTACFDISRIAVFLGDGTGALTYALNYPCTLNPGGFAVGDWSGDGLADIVTTATTSPAGALTILNTTPAVSSFDVSSVASSVAGSGFDVTVTAKNQSGATWTGYTGMVHFTSTDPQSTAGNGLPANYAFLAGDNGVHTFHNVTLKTAGNRTINVNDVGVVTATGSAGVSVSAAGFAVLSVTGYPTTTTAGDPHTITVTAKDSFTNTVTGYTGTVEFDSSDPLATPGSGLPTAFTFGAGDNGQHTFANVVLKTAGTRSIMVTDAVGPVTGSQTGITVTAGAAASIAVNSGSGQAATVNTSFAAPLVARVTDIYGNTVSGASVTFAAPGTGASATFPGGVGATTGATGLASVNATANTVSGSYGVTATVAGVATPALFSLANNPGAAAAVSVAGGGGQSTVVNTNFTSPLAARVTDAFGNPVSGASVTFAGPVGGASVSFPGGASATTDATGVASVTAKANVVAGSYGVTATIGVVATPTSFSLTNVAGSPTAIAVQTGGGQSATVNTSFGSPLVAVVTDVFGNPVPGASVTFAAPGSGASALFPGGATLTTDSNGRVQASVTANTVVGTYSVAATVVGVAAPASFGLTNTVGPAAAIAAAGGGGQSTTVATNFATQLAAFVTDAFGNVVPGVTVTFSAPGSGASATFPGGATAVTDATGTARVSARASSTAGGYSVTATASGLSSATASFGLTNTAGAAAAIAIQGGNGQSTTVNTSFGNALTARVTDAFGNPVAGVSVTFAAPGTGASATFSIGGGATTGATGLASLNATANTVSGSYSVTAMVAGVATPASFSLTNTAGAAAAVSVSGGSGQSTTVNTNFSTGLAARVTDSFGNPVSGVSVTFAAPGSGASASFPGGASATTNAAGVATITAKANTTAGSYSVSAAVAGVATPASFGLTNSAGSPAAVVAISGGGQSATVATDFSAPLIARVTDTFGNFVPGASVTFAGPASGATASFPTGAVVVTDAAGVAQVLPRSGTAAGSYSITATVTPPSGSPATFSLTNTAGAAAAVTMASGSPQSTVIAISFAGPLTAQVTDAFGNPVSGVAVTFAAPAAGAGATFPSGPAAASGADGRAQVTAAANSTPGSYTVTATAAGLAVPASFALTNLAAPPAAVSTVTGSGQSATVNAAFGTPLRVLVTDALGNPMAGVAVTFTGPATGAGVTFPAGSIQTTDVNGHADAAVNANTVAGSFSVSATVAGVATAATFALTSTAGPLASLAVVGGGGQTATVNTPFASPLSVHAADAFGNSVPGVTVSFAGPPSGAGATFPSGTATITGTSGLASLSAAANTVAGGYMLSATATGIAVPASFSLTNVAGPVTTITASTGSGQSTTVNTAFGIPLSAIASDSFGNAVAGVSVTFAAPGSGASVTFSGGAIRTTDANGRAQTSTTANTFAGSYSVAAMAAGVATPASFSLINNPGAAAAISVAGGSGQSTAMNTIFATALASRVTDAFGNPVSGVSVTFAAPGSGASASFPGGVSAPSNASGVATVTAKANTVAGTYSVTATVTNVATAASFSLTNQSAPALLVGSPQFAAGTDRGGPPIVRLFNTNATQRFSQTVFDVSVTGGVRTAAADFNADGIADVVVGSGPGSPSLVRVLDGVDAHELFHIAPFEPAFLGGVYVAAGDMTGDGRAELLVTPDEGGGPRVEIFRGTDFQQIGNFFGIDDSNFRGGARATVGDVTGDGIGDLVISAGFGGGPRISIYDGAALTLQSKLIHPVGDFFLFEPALRNGAFVAAGDVNGDGFADVIGGGGPGGGPRVYVIGGKELIAGNTAVLANFFAGNTSNRGGIRVSAKDLDGDRFADLVVGDGAEAGSHLTAYHGKDFAGAGAPVAFEFDAFPGFTGGVFVG